MLLSTAAEAAAITTAVTQASKKAFIRILYKFGLTNRIPTDRSHVGRTIEG
jgi:hypothetical protein